MSFKGTAAYLKITSLGSSACPGFRGPGCPALQPAHPLQTLSAPPSNGPQRSSQHLSWIWYPPALSWKLPHSEGNSVRLRKLRISYSWQNLALALILRAYSEGEVKSLVTFPGWQQQLSAAVVGLVFSWPSPGAFAEPTRSSAAHWAAQSSSGPTTWPLQHQPPCGRPLNSFSTHPNLFLSPPSSQVSLPWPKYKHQGHLLSQLWESCLTEPCRSQGLFPNPSRGLLAFPSVLTITISALSWVSWCQAALLPCGSVCLPSAVSLHGGTG